LAASFIPSRSGAKATIDLLCGSSRKFFRPFLGWTLAAHSSSYFQLAKIRRCPNFQIEIPDIPNYYRARAKKIEKRRPKIPGERKSA
jgi:hypothetical protein